MSEAKTMLDRCRELFRVTEPKGGQGGWTTLSGSPGVRRYLATIPADAPEQIADLTAKLAVARGVLGEYADDGDKTRIVVMNPELQDMGIDTAARVRSLHLRTGALARETLAGEPPASKRYRAIVKAAEALAHEWDLHDGRIFDCEGAAVEVVRAFRRYKTVRGEVPTKRCPECNPWGLGRTINCKRCSGTGRVVAT